MSYKKTIIGATCVCLALIAFSADAHLVGRLAATPGEIDYQAYYDDEADLTWLADANYVKTNGYAGADDNGAMLWQAANDWAAQLMVGGVSDWRLPDTIDVGNDGKTYANGNFYTGIDSGYNISTHSELSNLFYNVLGNLAFYDTNGKDFQAGWGPKNTGPFSNVVFDDYWSATEYPLFSNVAAWSFDMLYGDQGSHKKDLYLNAWAVYTGDVSAVPAFVPVPAAAWLFGSGLLGLIGFARRKSVNI